MMEVPMQKKIEIFIKPLSSISEAISGEVVTSSSQYRAVGWKSYVPLHLKAGPIMVDKLLHVEIVWSWFTGGRALP